MGWGPGLALEPSDHGSNRVRDYGQDRPHARHHKQQLPGAAPTRAVGSEAHQRGCDGHPNEDREEDRPNRGIAQSSPAGTGIDYLHLSFNTALAFSPTDVSAIKPWAKLMMLAEQGISLVVAILVVGRAINILK